MNYDIYLRPLRFEDHIWVQKHFNDYEMIQHLNEKVTHPFSIEEAKEYAQMNLDKIANGIHHTFVICLSENDRPIGRIDYEKIEGTKYTRGFWLIKELWGNGIMTKACKLTDNWIFTHTICETIEITNSIQNKASYHVKRKLGYEYLGVFDNKVKSKNGETKSDLWILTKKRWLDLE